MQIAFHDRAPLEKVRRLADGRIAAVAKFARSGCYQYAGAEVGRPDLSSVTVYRPESEVFDQAAMASFAHKAITLDHPPASVTADNWKVHSVGWTEGKVARDGEFVEIPLMLADASAVQAYEAGKNQLSAGYTCELVWGDGVAPSGESYQATQRQLRGNHIALVPAGRAGSECRIGDAAASSPKSIDEAVRQQITQVAKMAGMKPTEWLASQSPKKVEELVAAAAHSFVTSAAGAGIASTFKVDRLVIRAMSDAASSDVAAAETSDVRDARSSYEDAQRRLSAERRSSWRNG